MELCGAARLDLELDLAEALIGNTDTVLIAKSECSHNFIGNRIMRKFYITKLSQIKE